MTNGNKDQPMKLTVTFADGHTVDFDTFVAVVVDGLIPTGKENDMILYSASVDGFSCDTMASISADAPVVAGIIKALTDATKRIISDLDTGMAIQVAEAMSKLTTGMGTENYKHTAIVRRKISGN